VNRPSIAASTALLLLLGAEPTPRPTNVASHDVGRRVVVLGELGLPVGQDATIAGVKKPVGPGLNFIVESIEGKPSPRGLRIHVDGIGTWPDGTRATLRGNEVGTLRFVHQEDLNYAPNDDRWKGPYQQLFLSFHVSEVVSPEELKITPER
jgi:hypothetical protein